MKKFFYFVNFFYVAKDGHKEEFDLGIFSKKEFAIKKIEMSKNLKGFKNYPITNFDIVKFAVNFEEDVLDKSNIILYCVYHEYEKEEVVYYTIFDYVSTKEEAENQVEYLKEHSRVGKKYPSNFEITNEKVDLFTCWSEGFVKSYFLNSRMWKVK